MTEWLQGEVSTDEVLDDARAFLQDPRDTIIRVSLWSVKEEQFVDVIRPDRDRADRA